jgi:hypothetical protein
VALGVYDGAIAQLGLRGEFRELAHVRGIGRDAADCGPLMQVFADALQRKYELRLAPRIELDGQPFER